MLQERRRVSNELLERRTNNEREREREGACEDCSQRTAKTFLRTFGTSGEASLINCVRTFACADTKSGGKLPRMFLSTTELLIGLYFSSRLVNMDCKEEGGK